MSDEYQLRKDIDKLFSDFYNLETGSVNVLRRGDLDDIRVSIEDLYNQMSNHHHIEFDEIDVSLANLSDGVSHHLHDDWSVINLTNGTLCVNNRLKLAQINYNKSGVSCTANTWSTVETVSDLATYHPFGLDDVYYMGSNSPNMTIQIGTDGTIKANCISTGTFKVAFSSLYHYE